MALLRGLMLGALVTVGLGGKCQDSLNKDCGDDRKKGQHNCNSCISKHKKDLEKISYDGGRCYDKAKDWCKSAPKPTPQPPAPTPPPPSPTPPPPTPPPTPRATPPPPTPAPTPPPTPKPTPASPTPPPTPPVAPGQCSGANDCNAKECNDCTCDNKRCHCGGGWSGAHCENPFCTDSHNGCSSNGNCSMAIHSISCKCSPGFAGERCQSAVCSKTCFHGSVPDASCSACTACVGGWGGTDCNMWDSSLAPTELHARYTSHFSQVNASIQSDVEALRWQYAPIPGWLLFPDGLNPLTGRSTTPFVEMSFEKQRYWTDGSGNKLAIPDQVFIESAASCSTEAGVEYSGSDVGTASASSADECCSKCSSEPKCLFFSFRKDSAPGDRCLFKSSNVGRSPNPNHISGSRLCGNPTAGGPSVQQEDQPPVVLTSITDMVALQIASLRKGSGSAGLLGGLADPTVLNGASFGRGVAITVYDTVVPTYRLHLDCGSGNNSSNNSTAQMSLSRFATAAVESLPLQYNPQTKPVFFLFLDLFGTRIPVAARYGGLKESVRGWPKCIIKGAKPSPDPRDTAVCQLDAGNMQAKAKTRDYGGMDYQLLESVVGGDPTKAKGPAEAWAATVALNPVLLSYESRPLSDFLPTATTDGRALQAALAQAIGEYEGKQVARVKAAAAALEAKAKTRPQEYSATVAAAAAARSSSSSDVSSTATGGSCFEKTLGNGKGDFQCGGECVSYKYSISTGSDSSYSVTNPNPAGKQGAEVTCGCSTVPSEYNSGSGAARADAVSKHAIMTAAAPAAARATLAGIGRGWLRKSLSNKPGRVIVDDADSSWGRSSSDGGSKSSLGEDNTCKSKEGESYKTGKNHAFCEIEMPGLSAPGSDAMVEVVTEAEKEAEKEAEAGLKLQGVGACCARCNDVLSCKYWTYGHDKKRCSLFYDVPSGSESHHYHGGDDWMSGKYTKHSAHELRFCRVCEKPPAAEREQAARSLAMFHARRQRHHRPDSEIAVGGGHAALALS